MCTIFGKIAVAFLGFIDLPALQWLNGNGLYLTFAVMSAIAIFATSTIDYPETPNKSK
jgi:hypothetical protein